ncbi:phosphate transport system substrate-binding protein [Hespellia stercorisuis DSM 15480]|uniref:Phosphate transport system substrate-binding protein n=2 Tax=Hespellia stercorisuis TaxID=180311 RepID=A0A1M6MFW2_9FIRM|nr:phosphate transport system substrate-binding protein [Hespellia stercorisuis DSM 15480]
MKEMLGKRKLLVLGGVLLAGVIAVVGTKSAVFTVNADDGKERRNIVAVTREDGSGTRSAFGELTGLVEVDAYGTKTDRTSDQIAVTGSTEEMLRQIELTEDGIGYVSMGASDMESADVKIVNVNGMEPTKENIKNGNYELTRPLQLIYNGKLTDLEYDFLTYLKSAGQGIVADTDYIAARDTGIHLKKNVTGKIAVSGSSSMAPIMQVLAAAYMTENPGAEVQVTTSDSNKGMLDVMEGKSNFGMVSRDLYSYEKAVFQSETIAKDAIVVIVNKKNGLEDITTDQIQGIYTSNIENWEYLEVYE